MHLYQGQLVFKLCNKRHYMLPGLTCVTLRPHYLPREFSNTFVCTVFIPPSGNVNRAANQIADSVHRHLQNKPDAPILISLPGFYQYMKCNTRKNNVLDKCYGNAKDAYTARAKLSNSDHKAIHVLPTYRQSLSPANQKFEL